VGLINDGEVEPHWTLIVLEGEGPVQKLVWITGDTFGLQLAPRQRVVFRRVGDSVSAVSVRRGRDTTWAQRAATDNGRNAATRCEIDSAWTRFGARPPDLDERIAFRAPEYAGLYRDAASPAESSFVVMLTDPDASPHVTRIVREELARGYRLNANLRVARARYSYRELRSWLECYLRGAGAGHLSSWGLGIKRNRVTLGIAADSVRRRVEEDIRRLALPPEAFDIQVSQVRVGALERTIDLRRPRRR
jgi:hypothetical protein